jgi:hypothetical protein
MVFSPVFISLGPSYNQSAHQTPGSWAFFWQAIGGAGGLKRYAS